MVSSSSFAAEAVTLGFHSLITSEFARNCRILEIDATVIAQQITLFQHYLFSKIKGACLCFSAVLAFSTDI